jgi:hypothetical protein
VFGDMLNYCGCACWRSHYATDFPIGLRIVLRREPMACRKHSVSAISEGLLSRTWHDLVYQDGGVIDK